MSQDNNKLKAHELGSVIAIMQRLTRLKGFAIDTAHWMGVWLPSSPRYLTRMFAMHKPHLYKDKEFIDKAPGRRSGCMRSTCNKPLMNCVGTLGGVPKQPCSPCR